MRGGRRRLWEREGGEGAAGSRESGGTLPVLLILLPNVTNSGVVFARVRDLHFQKVQRRSEVIYFRRPSLPQARAA